jgi:hypothetical protein
MRGRPAGLMTHRRKQVLEALTAEARQGERIPWARVARRCGLYSFRDAQRIARDLKNLGAI